MQANQEKRRRRIVSKERRKNSRCHLAENMAEASVGASATEKGKQEALPTEPCGRRSCARASRKPCLRPRLGRQRRRRRAYVFVEMEVRGGRFTVMR